MWKGTPVVASDVGGIPTQMVDGKTGFLVAPMDYDGFAEKIALLMRDEALRKKLGDQAKEHVRENFLVTGHLLNYINMLLSF